MARRSPRKSLPQLSVTQAPERIRRAAPWFGLGGIALLAAASVALERRTLPVWAIVCLAAALFLWIGVARVAHPAPERLGSLDASDRRVQAIPLALALAAAAISWWKTPAEEFRLAGVVPWLASVALWLKAWWPPRSANAVGGLPSERGDPKWALRAALAGVFLVGAFFYFYRLSEVPANPVSDHAEEMLDMLDLIRGRHSIYFLGNLGREPLHFYWTCAFVKGLGLPLTFLTLKIATATVGVLAVLAMYLVGRELGGTALGLTAAAFVAWAKWPVGLARQGLDYTYAVLPSALTIWALLRYQRRGDRASALAAGVVVGAGLYGYTPFRAVPLLVPLALAAALLDPRRRAGRRRLVGHGFLIAGTAVLVFLPLLKFMLSAEHREFFWFRSATRMTDVERAVAGDRLQIFLGNLVNMLRAFHWKGSSTWTVILEHDPFLDVVFGGLLFAGVILVVSCALRGAWRSSWLLPAFFLLTLPSTLSLAYPHENPSLNRAAPAIPVVFVIAALPFASLCRSFSRERPGFRVAGLAALAGAVLLSLQQNSRAYFVDFAESYDHLMEHAMEMAQVLKQYRALGIPYSQAYLLGLDFWVDGRNIAFEIGDPAWADTHILPPGELPDDLRQRPLLFLYRPNDMERLKKLKRLYPGIGHTVPQSHPDRDFGAYVAR